MKILVNNNSVKAGNEYNLPLRVTRHDLYKLPVLTGKKS